MSNVKDKNVLAQVALAGGDLPVEATARLADVSDRIALVIEYIGLTEAADAAGKSEKQMRRYATGSEPPFGVLDALVRRAGVSFDWLGSGSARTTTDYELSLRGHRLQLKALEKEAGTNLSSTDRGDVSDLADVIRQLISVEQLYLERRGVLPSKAKAARQGLLSVGDVPPPMTPTSDGSGNGEDMIRLPAYSEVRAAAGAGIVPTSEVADSIISFDRHFLRDQGAVPEMCSVIWAHGDSMVPTIPDGSALIVDHSQTEVKNGSIMVINVGEDLLVKRVRRRLDGLIDLISDNAAYQPETLGPDALQQLRVIGRVVYFCRTP